MFIRFLKYETHNVYRPVLYLFAVFPKKIRRNLCEKCTGSHFIGNGLNGLWFSPSHLRTKIGHCFYDTCNPSWCDAIRQAYYYFAMSKNISFSSSRHKMKILLLCNVCVVFTKCFSSPHRSFILREEKRSRINNNELLLHYGKSMDCVCKDID